MGAIKVEDRTSKDSLHEMRTSGVVPGILFGGGIDSKMISMPEKNLKKFINGDGAVYEINRDNGKKFVMFDEVQRDPVSNKVLHFSLKVLPKGEKSVVDVPLAFSGNEQKTGDEGIYVTLLDRLNVIGVPSKIPNEISIDLSALELGESYTVSDLKSHNDLEFEETNDTVIAQYQYISRKKLDTEETESTMTVVEGEEEPITMSQ